MVKMKNGQEHHVDRLNDEVLYPQRCAEYICGWGLYLL